LRKDVLAIGIILILVGAVLTACHSASVKVDVNEEVNGVEKKLSVSGYFSSGQTLILGILPGNYWGKPIFEPGWEGVPAHKDVVVHIIDPHNNISVFDVYFVEQGRVVVNVCVENRFSRNATVHGPSSHWSRIRVLVLRNTDVRETRTSSKKSSHHVFSVKFFKSL